MRILSAHFNLLPYHGARYEAFMGSCRPGTSLTAVLFRTTEEYKLIQQEHRAGSSFAVLRPDSSRMRGPASMAREIRRIVHTLAPDLILLPGGYVEPEMRQVIREGAIRGTPLVLCSATKQDDANRVLWREVIKRRLLRLFSGFLVGGTRQRAYLATLGVPEYRIRDGYDVVDNAHYATGADAARSGAATPAGMDQIADDLFMTTVRFAPEKNLLRLLEAYALYRSDCRAPWDLVILGDGKLRPEIEQKRKALGLEDSVHLLGFKQYDDLPLYYGRARALILASTKESWGLVVNEAMACSLPVLVSEVCGCTADLVSPGENGFLFDPFDVKSIAGAMRSLSELDEVRYRAMADASARRIAEWGPARFARGLSEAIAIAQTSPRKRPGPIDRLLLNLFVRA